MSSENPGSLGPAIVVALLAMCGASIYAQNASVLPNPYRTIENPLRLPGGRVLGWVMGIALDRDGMGVWIVETCGGTSCIGSNVTPILKFDASGQLVKTFGAGMFAHPHGLHVDRDGNVWAIEGLGAPNPPTPAGRGHQVFKFSSDGQLLLTLGTAGVAGDGPDTFNMPSAVYVAPNGDIFVADGHGGNTNARVVKFTKDGKFIKAWGKKGSAPGEFDTPHSLAMDSRGRLFVADRGNRRIQIFDASGTFLEEWKQFGAPSEVFIDRNDVLYVTDSVSDEKTHPGLPRGVRIGSAKDGTVTTFIPDSNPNDLQELVVADRKGALYTGYTVGKALKKYVKD